MLFWRYLNQQFQSKALNNYFDIPGDNGFELNVLDSSNA